MPTTGIPLVRPTLPPPDDLWPQIKEVLSNGKLTNFGRYVTEFENEVSEYLGVEAVTTSSGTMGLIFALQAAGLERGQYVILPSFTFMATAQAVLYAGGIPLFAECRDDMTICVEDLRCLLNGSRYIGAVVGVHTFGLPAQVDLIQRTVDKASAERGAEIPLIYDAAHAFGSAVDSRRVGSFGTAEVFSLSPTKSLVAVEGGLIASHSSALISNVRKMRAYGIGDSYNAVCMGLNGKMSELHALVGIHNLSRFSENLVERQNKARYFIEAIQANTTFLTVEWPGNIVHTFKDFSILVPRGKSDARRQVQRHLENDGIETRSYFYPPVHQQDYFKRFAERSLPKTEDLSSRVLTIPFYSDISFSEIDSVVESLSGAQAALGL